MRETLSRPARALVAASVTFVVGLVLHYAIEQHVSGSDFIAGGFTSFAVGAIVYWMSGPRDPLAGGGG